MYIKEIIAPLEVLAPASLQEDYDNCGLLTGNTNWQCTGVLIALDATEAVVNEAKAKGCNLVIAHHPIIFGGLKKITGSNYVERAVITAIKNDIAIYAIHTNLDNVITGVNGKMADMLGLINRRPLQPKKGVVKKIVVYVPQAHANKVREALFTSGAGTIGNYSGCSFNSSGQGTFTAGKNTQPFVGQADKPHTEEEVKIEMVYFAWQQQQLLNALYKAHPYEEVAFDIYAIDNTVDAFGSGLMGELPNAMPEPDFLDFVKQQFGLQLVRHTALVGKPVTRVAICGGAGSFLTRAAVAAGADFYITADVKYHEFFDADKQLVLADIGHYESEQFTINLLFDILKEKFPTFAVQKTEVKTNPVHYFL
ncbi:MAG: hypothetical protein RL172_2102 [Bacteroidota bacterium]